MGKDFEHLGYLSRNHKLRIFRVLGRWNRGEMSPVKDKTELLGQFAEWKKLALEGDTEGEYFYGRMCFLGIDGDQDVLRALKYVRKSAYKGHKKANMLLGDMHFEGVGVNRSVDKAFNFWRKGH